MELSLYEYLSQVPLFPAVHIHLLAMLNVKSVDDFFSLPQKVKLFVKCRRVIRRKCNRSAEEGPLRLCQAFKRTNHSVKSKLLV